MGKDLSIDEIISSVKSSNLTTVLVEGTDDIMIYRWIEEEFETCKVNFLPCGGRSNLLKIYKRKDEFPQANVIFIADKDTYVYGNVPKEYSNIIWTHGYSIENDLYYGKK